MTNLIKLEYERQHREERRRFKLKAIGVVAIFIIAFGISVLTAHAAVIYDEGCLLNKLNSMPVEVGIAPNSDETSTQNGVNAAESAAETAENAAKTQHEYSGISISDDEYVELCQIVAAEAQTQSLEGQKAVVEVIFNRVLSDKFPNTIHGVLSQKGQFATWRLRNQGWVEPYRAVEAIASVVTNGRTVLPDTGYVYFDTHGVNGRKHIKIGRHYFGRQ